MSLSKTFSKRIPALLKFMEIPVAERRIPCRRKESETLCTVELKPPRNASTVAWYTRIICETLHHVTDKITTCYSTMPLNDTVLGFGVMVIIVYYAFMVLYMSDEQTATYLIVLGVLWLAGLLPVGED